MRADRLLSILLLLQAHGRMTAGDLARRLEVSRRTVCRDLDALSGAGVPVVTDRGANGGVYLLGGYRTDLTGLTAAELEALITFGGEGPAADLGFGPDVDRASRKLTVAAGSRATGRLRDRVLIDGDRWFRSSPVPAHLRRVQDALWLDRRLRLRYRRALDRVVEREVDPYGLVCKSGVWYLLAGVGGELRIYRVSRIEDAELSDEPFERPAGFDLRVAWAEQVGRFRSAAPDRYPVTVRVAPGMSDRFSRVAGDLIVERRGGSVVVLDFPGWWAAVGQLAMFGGDVEVVEPEELRLRMAGIGRDLIDLYGAS